MSLEHLQENVAHLSEEELKAFSQWFEEFMADQWDKEIERDVAEGRFKALVARVKANHESGLSTPL